MREIKVRIHARISRKNVRSGHLSPWIFLVFIDTLLILVWTYTVSLGKILFFGDFNAGKDWKNTLCIFQDQESDFFFSPKIFLRHRWHFPPFFHDHCWQDPAEKRWDLHTSDMYWAKFYFPFLSPRCLSGPKAVLFCSFSPFLLACCERKSSKEASFFGMQGWSNRRSNPKICMVTKNVFPTRIEQVLAKIVLCLHFFRCTLCNKEIPRSPL